MFAFIGGLIGGALGLAGSLFSGSRNRAHASAQQASQIDAQERAQQKQLDWERERATHYHQWQVDDLRKAGLNPILSAGGHTMTGSIGGVQGGALQGNQDNPGVAAANSAMAFQQMKLQARQQKNQDLIAESQVNLNSARAEKERADAQYRTQEIEGDYVARQIDQMTASAAQSRAATQNLKKQNDILEQDLLKGLEELKNLVSYRKRLEAETGERISAARLNNVRAMESVAEARLKEQLREKSAVDTALSRLDYDFRSHSFGRRFGRNWNEILAGLGSLGYDIGELVRLETSNYFSSRSVSPSRREGGDK